MLLSIEWNVILMFCMFSWCDLIKQIIHHSVIDNAVDDAFSMFFMYLYIEDIIWIDLDNRASCTEAKAACNVSLNFVLKTSFRNDLIQSSDKFKRFLRCTACAGTD